MMAEWAAGDPDFAASIGGVPAPAPFTGEVEAIWSLGYSHGTLFAGSKPEQLFASYDGGEMWETVRGLA